MDKKATKLIRQEIGKWTLRRDIYGYAVAIEREGYTILSLVPGSIKNVDNANKFIEHLNLLEKL